MNSSQSDSNHSPDSTTGAPQSKAYTPKKGRPTPKRKEAAARPGTFESRFTPAESYWQSRKKRKELKASMSAEEWKAYKESMKQERKKRQEQTRKGMDSGDERYLLDRDRGPERAFVRDLVDSKRYLNSFMMPFALVLLVVMLATNSNPRLASIVSVVAMAIIALFAIEAVMLGRRAARLVKEKFPHTHERNFTIGFYAFGRATQLRRWRTPKPRVAIGDTVA